MSEVSGVGAQISWFMLQSNYIKCTPVPMQSSPWANFLIVLGLGCFFEVFFNWPISLCFYPQSQNKTRKNVCGRSIPWREQAWLHSFFPTPFLFALRYSLPSLVLQTGFAELQSVMPKMSEYKWLPLPLQTNQSFSVTGLNVLQQSQASVLVAGLTKARLFDWQARREGSDKALRQVWKRSIKDEAVAEVLCIMDEALSTVVDWLRDGCALSQCWVRSYGLSFNMSFLVSGKMTFHTVIPCRLQMTAMLSSLLFKGLVSHSGGLT